MSEKERAREGNYYQYDPVEVSLEAEEGEELLGTVRTNSLRRSFHPFAAASKDNLAEEIDASPTTPGMSKKEDEDDEDEPHSALLLRKVKGGHKRPVFRARDNTLSTFAVLLYCAGFVCAVTLCYVIIMMTQSLNCLGAPYLYVTHQNSRNVMKFSRDGCLIHEKILWGLTTSLRSNLRSMVFAPYRGKQALYVADSDEDKSGVMVFDSCLSTSSLRPFIRRIGSSMDYPGAQHTYGISLDKNGDIYASFQKTDVVMRFSAEHDYLPIPNEKDLKAFLLKKAKNQTVVSARRRRYLKGSEVPVDREEDSSSDSEESESDRWPELQKKSPNSSYVDPTADFKYFEGTFVQFGAPNWHNYTEQGVRAILWVKNHTELWIANEDVHQVVIVNRHGKMIGSVPIHSPIGLYSTPDQPHVVFVGSKNKKGGGVFAFDIFSRKAVKSYTAIGMKHPTGIVSYEDVLFVGDQSRNAIITFNMTTTRVIKMIIPDKKIKGYVEQIALSDC